MNHTAASAAAIKTCFLMSMLLFPFSAFAQNCTPPGLPKIIGLDYHTARAALIKAGFLPVKQKHNPDGAPFEFSTSDSLGYIEAVAFGFTGNASGLFAWRSKKAPFSVSATACEFMQGECVVTSVTCR